MKNQRLARPIAANPWFARTDTNRQNCRERGVRTADTCSTGPLHFALSSPFFSALWWRAEQLVISAVLGFWAKPKKVGEALQRRWRAIRGGRKNRTVSCYSSTPRSRRRVGAAFLPPPTATARWSCSNDRPRPATNNKSAFCLRQLPRYAFISLFR